MLLLLVVLRLALTALAFGITAWLLPGMEMSGGFFGYLWVSLLFGLVNAAVGTILRALTLPFGLVVLGLLAIVINAILLELTDALTDNLTIDEFWWTAIWASIILALVLVALEAVLVLLVARRLAPEPGAGGRRL
ncbi:MAG TPA: phage holin family protein [Gaiellaceae bacterium]|nr:phage holin family protein [Gaiellaceae bacterium]